MKNIILKPGKDEAVKRFHPWIFSGAIKKINGSPAEGDIVSVYNFRDEFLGKGHYAGGSIAVRLFAFEDREIDYDFWKEKIGKAFQYRVLAGIAGHPDLNVYRLVHAEGDGLPGLIIDYYNGHVVIQAHSIGMYRLIDTFSQVVTELYGDALVVVYDKSSETLPASAQAQNKVLFGHEQECVVNEYGNLFRINYIEGQKTGFFIDQRENRKLLQHYSKEKTVLNTFCYSGGFSMHAIKAGASLVHSVDSSRKAIEMAETNAELNKVDPDVHKSFVADSLNFIRQSDTPYDIIILDPPAFAKHRDVKHNAVQGYKRLNTEAILKVKPGGYLFTFSCSQVIDTQLFRATVISAAISTGREARIIHQLSQGPDHPVNAFHPESDYLKGLVLFIS